MSVPPQTELDPVFVHAKRETFVLLVTFTCFLIWSVSASYYLGYCTPEDATFRTVLGMPHWVFWGIALPWLFANVFTFGFGLCYMADDPLGQALDEQGMDSAESEGEQA